MILLTELPSLGGLLLIILHTSSGGIWAIGVFAVDEFCDPLQLGDLLLHLLLSLCWL